MSNASPPSGVPGARDRVDTGGVSVVFCMTRERLRGDQAYCAIKRIDGVRLNVRSASGPRNAPKMDVHATTYCTMGKNDFRIATAFDEMVAPRGA